MTVVALAPISPPTAATVDATHGVAAASHSSSAFDAVLQGMQQVNADLNTSAASTADLALGRTDNLSQVMMQAEQARIEFELMVQVRNKLVEAYQELLRTQA